VEAVRQDVDKWISFGGPSRVNVVDLFKFEF
jgi:hypothetical protein